MRRPTLLSIVERLRSVRHMKPVHRTCNRCVMDTTEPGIRFDAHGHCSSCSAALDRMRRQLIPAADRPLALEALVEQIRADGRGRDYDCIIGVSGGVDSTMVALTVKELGLRPLAVHFDNGWNSELAVDNLRKMLSALDIDLYTHVVDWEEFRDLQLSFLRASVANAEAPTDHAITALLFRTARKHGVRYILSGSNLATECIMPLGAGHYNQDLRLLESLHARFGSIPLRTTPTISIGQYLEYVFVDGIRQVPFLNYIEYRKAEAREKFQQRFGWRDYGGKHNESVWTRFFQGYYLVKKFGFDKRRAYLSALICSGQASRDQALAELEKPPYDPLLLRQDLRFVVKKLGLTEADWEDIMRAPPRLAREYPSNHILFHSMRRWKNVFRAIATSP